MRDYWMTQSLLQVMGWGYVAVVVLALLIAAWAPRRNPHKALWVLIVLVIGSILPIKSYRQYEEQKQASEERKQKYVKAKALFDERCKTAGEKIYKTVENVEGILLLKVRKYESNKSSAMMVGAAAAHESYGDFYIRSFLRSGKSATGSLNSSEAGKAGYLYADSIDEIDGKVYRYKLSDNDNLDKKEIYRSDLRYGVTYEDLMDVNDRNYWIAGSVIKVVDVLTKEILGEKMRYVIDPAQGSLDGQRTPWLFAHGCGMETSYGEASPSIFSEKVLKSVGG